LWGTALFDVLCVKIFTVEHWKNPKRSGVNFFDAQFRAYGEKKPLKGS